MSAKRKWFPGAVTPTVRGFYDAQDFNMNCGCCHMTLHWDGSDWHSDLFERGRYSTLFFRHRLKRWREPAKGPQA